ncbi:MAG TPA: DsbA family oxidoreductase [Chthoniobacterales bacterium]|nr:DsbA family oxidoreductase [Chthoniobacterales bacterium]
MEFDPVRTRDEMTQLSVSIVSDVVCPWCYIGKRRFEKALLALNRNVTSKVSWQPFELNPQMPREGMYRKAYRIAKFGSWAESQAMDARVADAGAGEGITFNFDAMKRTPNTFDAHRLIRFAGQRGRQDEVVEQLFRAYFVEGSDVGDRETLLRIAEFCNLPQAAARSFLETDEGTSEVERAARNAQRSGISGVPTFIINDTYTITGAQSVDAFRAAFTEVLSASPSPL